jgi:hypothetical protein
MARAVLMLSYQDIRQRTRLDGVEILHLSDDENHLQYIHVSKIKDEEPFVAACDDCNRPHFWRRVWVIA